MPNLSLMVLEGELVGQFSEEKGIDLTTDHSHSTTMRSINYNGSDDDDDDNDDDDDGGAAHSLLKVSRLKEDK